MKTLLSLLIALVAVVSLACTNTSDESEQATVSPTPLWSVEDARRFEEFPLYWLGESFQGLPLIQVARIDYPGAFPGEPYNSPLNEVYFIYGDCEIGPGEEGCPVPLSIHIRPYCDLPPEVIVDGVKVGPPEVIRGAVVQRTAGNSVQLWTSNVSIGINSIETSVGEVVRNLLRLNGGKPTSPGEDLGPPDSLDKLNCPPIPTLTPTSTQSMEAITASDIQLGEDGKYFVPDRGDGCEYREIGRTPEPTYEAGTLPAEVMLWAQGCEVGIAYEPSTGHVNWVMPLPGER